MDGSASVRGDGLGEIIDRLLHGGDAAADEIPGDRIEINDVVVLPCIRLTDDIIVQHLLGGAVATDERGFVGTPAWSPPDCR